jgi:8-oxo-dGTP pyrophosphatase MutT (NUDIX family)
MDMWRIKIRTVAVSPTLEEFRRAAAEAGLLQYVPSMSGREQAGVIPFRRKKAALEVCLIRKKGRKKWKIPKGFVDPGETMQQSALKEAWEEAGLRGRLIGEPIGSYEYEKCGYDLTVSVFLMEVSDQEDEWEESRFRERCWLTVETAFAMLKKHPVRPLLDAAATRLERRKKPR